MRAKRVSQNPSPLMIVSSNPRGRKRRRSRRRGGGGAIGFVRGFTPNVGNVKSMAMGAAQGAVGALAVNAAVRFIPLPELLVTGRAIYATRFALALGIGMLASHVNSRLGMRMTEGALTVLAVDVIRDAVRTTTGYELGGMQYFSPARVIPAASVNSVRGVGALGKQLSLVGQTGRYLSGGMGRVGAAANRAAIMPGYGRQR